MAVQLGSGEYTFEVNENWAKVPEEITLGDCAAVGVDRQNRVYAFNQFSLTSKVYSPLPR